MLAASSGSKAFYAPPRRNVRPQRGSRRLQPARASSSSSTSSTIYKPRVPFVDLYEVLALEPSATDGEVKTAYRILQKAVHPDLAGEYASAAAALVNEAASVLTSPADRARFDRDRSEWLASGRGSSDQSLMDPSPLSAWSGPSEGEPEDDRGRHDAAFVDESACIGCLKCALIAPTTFWIETRFGCARVVDQWADGREAVEDAVAACPVQCIHFVNRRAELPLLERVAARQWRDGGSGGGANPAARLWRAQWRRHSSSPRRSGREPRGAISSPGPPAGLPGRRARALTRRTRPWRRRRRRRGRRPRHPRGRRQPAVKRATKMAIPLPAAPSSRWPDSSTER